jgi:hypothetical protein
MEYSSKAIDVFTPEWREPLFDVPGLNWNEPALCAELSRLAYFHFEDKQTDNEAVVRDACAKVGLKQAHFFNDPGTGTQAFAVLRESDSRAFVVFRGTQPDKLLDYVIDAGILLEPWKELETARVHSGFQQAYQQPAIAKAIALLLDSWREGHPNLQETYTGHSLGAALATLAAAGAPGATLTTFGSPRVGDSAFAGRVDASAVISRYVDCCDVVTDVPPEFLAYDHVDALHYIDRNRKVWATLPQGDVDADRSAARCERPSLLELKALLTVALRNPLDGNVPRFLSDHAIINYIQPLLALPKP